MIKKGLKTIAKPVANTIFDFCCDVLMAPAKIRKGRNPFNSEELRLVHRALLSQNLFSVDGKMIPVFEREFAQTYGVPYAVASTSGTAAIHTALGALDLTPGDEVITAPITDLGTIVPVLHQNAIPVFADIDDTYNMDPADVEKKITPRTKAIIVVHLFGNPCNMDAMTDIARRHRIPLVEDCAQAHMSEYKGKYVGTIGDIGCFSFQQSKHMTTGEGGMTITSNREYYERMKFFIDKGWARKGWGPRAYLFLAPNYRPTELVGAIGLAQLKKVQDVVRKRHDLGEYLSELLSKIEGVRPAPVTSGAKHSYWLYPMRLPEGVDANLFAQGMTKENIWVSAGYTGKPIYLCTEALTEKKTYGLSQCPFTCRYTEKEYEYREGLCPRAEEALKHLICIPLNESWKKEDVKRAVSAVEKSMTNMASKEVALSVEIRERGRFAPRSVSAEKEGKKIRIGIIGCGQMGRWHLDAYRSNPKVDLVAFADTQLDRAQQFQREVGAKKYSSHLEMLENERLDGVSICTLPATHKEITLDVLNARVHVLCEKPLAISVAEAEEMSRKADEKKLLLLTAFKFRFFDEVMRAKELIEKGSLGNILNFRLMFGGFMDMSGTWYVRKELSGGGVIMDNGPHAVDLVRFLFGEIEAIDARISHRVNGEVENTAKLTMGLKTGAVGTCDLSWSFSVPSKTYLEIYGEDGTVLLDLDGITYKFNTWNEWKRISNQINGKEAFARQIDHFVGAISQKPTIVKNEDGPKSQMIIDAAYESVKQDRKISLSEI